MPYSPLIGIPQITARKDFYDNYMRAVEAAGGTPLTIMPDATPAETEAFIDRCDGFVFMGGPDFHPERYGGTFHPAMKMLPDNVEEFFISFATTVIKKTTKPALGICLGNQLINIVLGGTLYQDIYSQIPSIGWHSRPVGAPTQETMHAVSFPPDSPLRLIFGSNTICANSSHHQAVKTLGDNLQVAAIAEDGIIEAIAPKNFRSRFLIGLQWHPERLAGTISPHERIFQALVNAARR